jgi:hypothetical protein
MEITYYGSAVAPIHKDVSAARDRRANKSRAQGAAFSDHN